MKVVVALLVALSMGLAACGGPSEAVWGNELWKGIDRNAGGE